MNLVAEIMEIVGKTGQTNNFHEFGCFMSMMNSKKEVNGGYHIYTCIHIHIYAYVHSYTHIHCYIIYILIYVHKHIHVCTY